MRGLEELPVGPLVVWELEAFHQVGHPEGDFPYDGLHRELDPHFRLALSYYHLPETPDQTTETTEQADPSTL